MINIIKKYSSTAVRLCAKYEDKQVTIQQIGTRASGYNGAKTIKGEKYLAKHNDILELLYGKHIYKIEFNPPPNDTNLLVIKPSKKRNCIDSESDDENDMINVPSKRPKSEEIDLPVDTMSVVNDIVDQDDPCEAGASTKIIGKKNIFSTINDVWEEIDNQALLIFTSKGVQGSEKIAGYDMDGTLITTQSGNVFPRDHNDWKLLYSDVPGKLKKIYNEGFKIVIFTNQRGLGLGKSKHSDFKQKIEKVVTRLGIPVQVIS